MREYKVTIGGRELELRYTDKERLMLEDRFDCSLADVLHKAFPMNNGKATITGVAGGMLRMQRALAWAGLSHHPPRLVTETWVSESLEKAMKKEGGNFFDIISTCVMAVYASGVLGAVVIMDRDDEGKDVGADDAGSPTPQTSPST